MKTKRNNEQGMAMVLATLATIVILGALAVVVQRVQSEKRAADFAVGRAVLDEACKAGIDVAIERVWNQYLETNGNTTGNLASYRVFINALLPTNEDLNHNGIKDGEEWDFNGDGDFDVNDPLAYVSPGDPLRLAGGAEITQLNIERSDDLTGSTMIIEATARYNGESRSARQTIRISGELFEGFEYGIMANNINCILCHAQFHNLDMALNTDPTNYGDFDRIKVAALESLMIRTNENINSGIAGTVYTRGQVYNQSNSLLSSSQVAGSTLKSYKFSTINGKLQQDNSGLMSTENLANAGTDSEGLLNQFSNLYMNYPTDESKMTDGTLPNKFPAPYPDDNGNRAVDDDEFSTVVNSANGSIVFELDPAEVGGSVTAGVAYGIPTGTAYTDSALPSASNTALQNLEDDGSYDGNLILIGTEYDPITIDNTVAINGDLVIKGNVKGWGQLLVRGNVYVIGDVTYDDAPGEFGVASDGTKNGLAVTSGGSIMMGDYLTIRARHHSTDTGKFPGGGFIDTRTQHKNQNISKNGTTQSLPIGYFDPGVVDAGWGNGSNTEMSFTSSELMLFNRREYLAAQADPTYVPRYYRLRPSQPLYQYTANDEHTVKYDTAGLSTITPSGNYQIQDLNPNLFWLSEDQLRNFWYQDEMQRASSGDPFRFDGLLYSNNAIFGITRSKDRHKSNTYGRMIIRGSIVSADLGMLVPGPDFSIPRDALDLYYDKRVADFFRVEDTTRVEFRRLAYRPL